MGALIVRPRHSHDTSASCVCVPTPPHSHFALHRFHLTPGNRAVHWVTNIVEVIAIVIGCACFPLYAPGSLLAPNPSLLLFVPLLVSYYLMSFRLFVRPAGHTS